MLHPSSAALHGVPFRCQLEIVNFKVKVDHDYQITDLFDSLCYSFCQQEWVKTYYMRIVYISLLLLTVSLYTTNLQSLGTVFFPFVCVFFLEFDFSIGFCRVIRFGLAIVCLYFTDAPRVCFVTMQNVEMENVSNMLGTVDPNEQYTFHMRIFFR